MVLLTPYLHYEKVSTVFRCCYCCWCVFSKRRSDLVLDSSETPVQNYRDKHPLYAPLWVSLRQKRGVRNMHHYIKRKPVNQCWLHANEPFNASMFPVSREIWLLSAWRRFFERNLFLNLLVSDLHHDILVETVKITSLPLISRTEVKVEFIV